MWINLQDILRTFGWALLLSFVFPLPAFVLLTQGLLDEFTPVSAGRRLCSAILAQLTAVIAMVLALRYFVWGPLWLVCFIGACLGGWTAYGLLLIWLGQNRRVSFRIANLFALISFLSLWLFCSFLIRS